MRSKIDSFNNFNEEIYNKYISKTFDEKTYNEINKYISQLTAFKINYIETNNQDLFNKNLNSLNKYSKYDFLDIKQKNILHHIVDLNLIKEFKNECLDLKNDLINVNQSKETEIEFGFESFEDIFIKAEQQKMEMIIGDILFENNICFSDKNSLEDLQNTINNDEKLQGFLISNSKNLDNINKPQKHFNKPKKPFKSLLGKAINQALKISVLKNGLIKEKFNEESIEKTLYSRANDKLNPEKRFV